MSAGGVCGGPAPDSGARTHIRLRIRRRRNQRGGIFLKLIFLLAFLLLLAIVYFARRPLLRAAGDFWIVDEPPEKADAIVILGDDNYAAERAARAAELYHAGWAPRIVASGRFLRPYASIAELMQHDLIERKVPDAAILRFPHRARDTREEAQELRRLFVERGWRRILLVTSSYHTRRARYICSRIFPAEIELRVVAARDSDYDPNSWWETRGGVKIFFHEAVGIVVAMWELRHEPDSPAAARTAFLDSRPSILHTNPSLFVRVL